MKASLKFREDQKPLFRAKAPLSIVGLPFQSGIVAGESKELSLNLATFFESGPSIKIAYRPNDQWNPFSLIVKTGTGPFGSPISSSMLMSAEFNLLGKGSPSFMLHFKPQFGDFSIKKLQSSSDFEKSMRSLQNGHDSSDDDGSVEVVDTPVANGGVFSGKRIAILPPHAASTISGLLSGVEISAKTKLPLRSRAVMNFRWGLRVPALAKTAGGGGDSTAGINFRKMPFLAMSKIGIEHVDTDDSKSEVKTPNMVGPEHENVDVAEACMRVKRQLEVLQAENGQLKAAVENLREDIAAGKLLSPAVDLDSVKYTGSKNARNNGKKPIEGGVSEELKKTLKVGVGGGGAA